MVNTVTDIFILAANPLCNTISD